jgi:two-component system chemotaxis response regulator CheB
MNKINVFIVEDSLLMQKVIEDTLQSDSQIVVVGKAKTGKEALENIPRLRPDVVTMDVNLPDMSGLVVLKELMAVSPVRVVMLSAYTSKGAQTTVQALELGAVDFIPKPSGEESSDLLAYKDKITAKIKMVAEIDLKKTVLDGQGKEENKELAIKNLVVIGASTGGPKVILDVMSRMPFGLDTAFLIIQHMPKGFTKSFAERISWRTHVKTKEAEDGDLMMNGAAFVAPSGYHMIIEKIAQSRNRYCLRLDETPLVNYVRPAVDVTMRSAAEVFSGKIIGVVLTGMGKDGMEGARAIKKAGGKIIAQSEPSCVIYGMPKAVVEGGFSDEVLPFEKIPGKIIEYLN